MLLAMLPNFHTSDVCLIATIIVISCRFNFRRDAFDSSKLSKDARWGNFPSVSAGWTISNEKFFKDNISRDAISFLKLRGSWGKNGNVNVLSGYQYASPIAMNQSFYQYNPSIGDGKLSYGSKPTGIANPDLTWETSEQVDLGLDARFLNDRLDILSRLVSQEHQGPLGRDKSSSRNWCKQVLSSTLVRCLTQVSTSSWVGEIISVISSTLFPSMVLP